MKKSEANEPKTTTVFMSGTSQAVRLPKGYRFSSKRVSIERHGNSVVLTPIPETWDDLCIGRPEDIEDWLAATDDRGLGPLETRVDLK